MCTNYTPTSRDRLKAARLGVAHLPPNDWPAEVFPGYEAPIVVRGEQAGGEKAGVEREGVVARLAQFGLVPGWCRDRAHASSIAKGTYNARSETVADKPSFRGAWKARQFALVPMESYYDPNWEEAAHNGGRSVRWRIALHGGEPFTCAALWEQWQDRVQGTIITSFTLLTVNADGHALCGRLHRPGDEKRMPVIVAANDRLAWLNASPDEARAFLHTTDAALMMGGPAPLPPRTARPSPIGSAGRRATTDVNAPADLAGQPNRTNRTNRTNYASQGGNGQKAVPADTTPANQQAVKINNNYSLF